MLDLVLATLPYKQRPREKNRPCLMHAVDHLYDVELGVPSEDLSHERYQACLEHAIEHQNKDGLAAPSQEYFDYELHVVRTFLTFVPVPKEHIQVCQSTTDAVIESDFDFDSHHHFAHFRGPNPR